MEIPDEEVEVEDGFVFVGEIFIEEVEDIQVPDAEIVKLALVVDDEHSSLINGSNPEPTGVSCTEFSLSEEQNTSFVINTTRAATRNKYLVFILAVLSKNKIDYL